MITKEFVKQINPKQVPYNPKYSEGTYQFLHKNINNNVKILWWKKNWVNGRVAEFKPSDIKFYPSQIYFMINEKMLGVSWTNIMNNKYKVSSYLDFDPNEFEDITGWFCENYLKVGRCLFDSEHINFLLGENHSYVTEDKRFEMIDGVKECRWCGKEIK